MEERALTLCKNYNFEVINDETKICRATGLGDLLYLILGIQQNLVETPTYINLHYFMHSNMYYIDPITHLEFRLKLLTDLLINNNINPNIIKFVKNSVHDIVQPFIYHRLQNLHLNWDIQNNTIKQPYIIFHTKLRFHATYDMMQLKEKIKKFAESFRTEFTIVLMGERIEPQTDEAKLHRMSVCYEELLKLKDKNTVLDLTVENCDSPNYDQYRNDVGIIQNACMNISFGCGGSTTTSMIMGKGTIFYVDTFIKNMYFHFNNNLYLKHNIQLYVSVDEMINYIIKTYGIII